MFKTLTHIFESIILIHQKKKNTSVPVEILLQDQGPWITKNKTKEEEGINHSLGGLSGRSSARWYSSTLTIPTI